MKVADTNHLDMLRCLRQSLWQVRDKPVCVALMEFNPLQCTGKVGDKVGDKVLNKFPTSPRLCRELVPDFVAKSAQWNLGWTKLTVTLHISATLHAINLHTQLSVDVYMCVHVQRAFEWTERFDAHAYCVQYSNTLVRAYTFWFLPFYFSAYTTLNELLAVFLYIITIERRVGCSMFARSCKHPISHWVSSVRAVMGTSS